MQNTEIHVVMKYEFLRGTNAAETVRNINAVFGTEVTSQPTVSRWFAKFRSGEFELTNETRGRPETKVDNDVLKATVESNPAQSALDLSLMLENNIDTFSSNRKGEKAGQVALVGKKFNTQEAVESAFQQFIDSRDPGFYSKGINELPQKWQNCVDSMGAYFD